MRADTLYVRDECGEFVPAKPEVVLARAKEHLKPGGLCPAGT